MRLVLLCVVLGAAVQAYPELFREVRGLGAEITDAVAYPHIFPDTGVGMIATRDIGPGESLFTFPLTACVSQTNLKDQDLKVLMRGLLPFYALVLTVLHEQLLGASSKHSTYLSLLDPELVPLPKFWSGAELALLQDDSAIFEFTQQAGELRREFDRLKAALRRHARHELDEYVSLDRFYWACGIVQSRSFESVNGTNALIPVADLLNSHPTNYVAWGLREDGVDGYHFGTFPHRGILQGEQVFNMYGGGEHNLHTMGEYGYIPFPNPLNSQELHLNQVTSTDLERKLALLGPSVRVHFAVQGPELLEFFQVASSTREEPVGAWQSERNALSLCVSALRRMLDAMGTTVGEDYQWLHRPNLPYRTRLAVMFRIDRKALLARNLYLCEQVQAAMACWTGHHPQSLVARWRYYSALRVSV